MSQLSSLEFGILSCLCQLLLTVLLYIFQSFIILIPPLSFFLFFAFVPLKYFPPFVSLVKIGKEAEAN